MTTTAMTAIERTARPISDDVLHLDRPLPYVGGGDVRVIVLYAAGNEVVYSETAAALQRQDYRPETQHTPTPFTVDPRMRQLFNLK